MASRNNVTDIFSRYLHLYNSIKQSTRLPESIVQIFPVTRSIFPLESGYEAFKIFRDVDFIIRSISTLQTIPECVQSLHLELHRLQPRLTPQGLVLPPTHQALYFRSSHFLDREALGRYVSQVMFLLDALRKEPIGSVVWYSKFTRVESTTVDEINMYCAWIRNLRKYAVPVYDRHEFLAPWPDTDRQKSLDDDDADGSAGLDGDDDDGSVASISVASCDYTTQRDAFFMVAVSEERVSRRGVSALHSTYNMSYEYQAC